MELIEVKRSAERDLLSGLIRIHVLYHACQEPIFGAGMIEELQRHGYKLSSGTLYPLLHGLEREVICDRGAFGPAKSHAGFIGQLRRDAKRSPRRAKR